MDLVHLVGQAGLALFIVGVAHELRLDREALRDRAVGWVTVGALVPSALAGALLGGVVLWTGRSELRGDAPPAAFILLMTIALAVSAVPVLARILVDRGLSATRTGRLAITAAVAVDAVAWLLLAVVAGIVKGSGRRRGRGGHRGGRPDRRPARPPPAHGPSGAGGLR
ncbi:cation:proton antiporter [Nonomuraea antimicrobica]